MKKKLFAILTLVLMSLSLLLSQVQVFANDGGYYYDVYVCTSDGYLNMREEPNTDSLVTYILPDCAHLEVYDVAGNWGFAYFEDGIDYQSGWIYLPATKPTYREARDNAGKAIDKTVYVNAPEGYINLRSEPSASLDNVYCKIPNNSEIHLTRKTDKGWALTTFDSYTGWIALSGTQEEPLIAPAEESDVFAENNPAFTMEEERDSSDEKDPFLFDNPFLMFTLGGLVVLLVVLVITLLVLLFKRKKSEPAITPMYTSAPPENTYDEPTAYSYNQYDQRNQ